MNPFRVADPGEYLAAVSTTEGRLLATAAVIVVAALLGTLATPRATRLLVATVRSRAGARAGGAIDAVSESFPWPTPVMVPVRAIQLAVYALAGASLFLIWGRWELAAALAAGARSWLPLLGRVALTGALLVAAWVATELLANVLGDVTDELDGVSAHQEQIVLRLAQLSLFTLAGFAVLTLWQVDLSGLLVGAGFLGIVVGLAARQTIGSLVAGVVLMFSRPFEIGDWVQIGEEEGIVTEISVITTRLRSFDGEYVSIPNDRVGDSVVRNRSAEGRLRLRLEVGVDYETDTERAAEVAMAAVRSVPEVVDNPSPVIVPTGFGDSAVLLELRFWIDRPTPQQKWRAIRGVVYGVKGAFEREGIKIPFPQRELTGRAESGGFRVVGSESAAPPRNPGATRDGGT